MLKRALDVMMSATGLIALLPFLAALAVVVRLTSHGPALYRGVRVGRHGQLFRMLKFRTMVTNAESWVGYCTPEDDPRITPIGRWLRKYKLDELPQLLNVLKGDMSFVGPRPEVQRYTDLFNGEEKQILEVRPGITDWATLSNSDEEAILAGTPDPERAYLEDIRPGKIQLQLKYVHERSLWIDFKILFATVLVVLRRCFGGASPERSRRQHSLGRET